MHWLRRLVILVVMVLGVLAVIADWADREYQPPGAGRAIDLVVTTGETVSDVGRQLQSQGLIRNALVFRVYWRLRENGQPIQAGHYQLVQGTGIPDIAAMLATGKVINTAVTVIIPEGFTVVQIADRLASSGVCTKSEFLYEVQKGTFSEPFLAGWKPGKDVKYRLEGYLFPDTYDFDRGENAHAVVADMLNDFQRHIQPLLGDIGQSGQSLTAVITEASLIEREAKVEVERPIIASVIDNRLKVSMKLEIDATIEYILGHRDVVTYQDLQVKDPYNTYLHNGLPPGPIASPGIASIDAVLHPAHTHYLYYVTKNDGSGEHYFAVTYQQQLHNEGLSQQNLKSHSP